MLVEKMCLHARALDLGTLGVVMVLGWCEVFLDAYSGFG